MTNREPICPLLQNCLDFVSLIYKVNFCIALAQYYADDGLPYAMHPIQTTEEHLESAIVCILDLSGSKMPPC